MSQISLFFTYPTYTNIKKKDYNILILSNPNAIIALYLFPIHLSLIFTNFGTMVAQK